MWWGLMYEPCLTKSTMTNASRAGECTIGAVCSNYQMMQLDNWIRSLPYAGEVWKRAHHATHSTANGPATWKRTTPANIHMHELTPKQNNLCNYRVCVCDWTIILDMYIVHLMHLTNGSSPKKTNWLANLKIMKQTKPFKPVGGCVCFLP